MNSTMDYCFLGSFALVGLSFVLSRGTSPFSEIDCSTYDKRRARRIAGLIAFVAAVLVFFIGMLAGMVAMNR
jgi:hypothetical protein